MPELTPLDDNRQEHFLNGEDLEPITRREHFYAGRESELPAGHQEPETREEWFIQKYRGGGGGDITVESLSVTSNGTYTAPSGKAYSPVEVNVPLPQNAYLLKSVANLPQPIASFSDGADAPMKSLKVAIEPQQDLHGYDSPWVGGAGKNKFADGTISFTSSKSYPCELGAGTYTLSALVTSTDTDATTCLFVVRDSDNQSLTNGRLYRDARTYATFTIIEQASNIIFYSADSNAHSTDDTATWTDVQVETGSTATAFAPYSNICPISGWDEVNITVADDDTDPTVSNVYTIDLDGTRYGGKVDVSTGELVVTHKLLTMSDITWLYSNSLEIFYATLSDYKKTSTTTKPNAECEVFNVVGRNKVLTDRENGLTFGNVGEYDNRILVRESSFTDLPTFESAISGKKLVYELATPLTIQLTPTAVKSLLGSNNVWADTGDITDAEYFSKEV